MTRSSGAGCYPLRILCKADRVRELTARRGFTLGELSERAGISPSHMSKVLGGQHELSARKRRVLLNALGAAFDDLFEFEPDCEAARV